MAQKSVDYELIAHPHTGSSHETALASHVREDHIAKAVIVRDFSGYAMIVVPATYHVEMKHVCRVLDRELELVDEDELAGLFADCEAGAIPPIGLAYDIETFLDETLTTLADVYFESGDHQHLVHVSGDSFNHLLSGVRRGHFSHGK
ncbi:MAG: YbaK/EbsC family protein [Gammaproteobacteria bacterium]|nr:YbaK/EbsC family protein [Gammaproteobacteria bacterium]